MKCEEFHELIVERLSSELSAEREAEFDQHQQACAACQAEVAAWQQLESRLRQAWPSEDVPPLGLVFAAAPPRGWFDHTRVWFARASTALVAGCLLALVLLRPSVEWNQTDLRVAFGAAARQPVAASEAQVQAWVEAAVQEVMSREAVRLQGASGAPVRAGEEARPGGEVLAQLKMLEQGQGLLWQQVQQQEIYLESLWRANRGRLEPAGQTQQQ